MRRSRFGLAGALSLCLAFGYGMVGCQDDEEAVTIDLDRLCAQALQDMNTGCKETVDNILDPLRQCVIDCGMEDGDCVEECLADPDSGLGVCAGEIQFLLSGVCGGCYAGCAFDFVGDESDPGCLPDPANPVNGCLDALYACVNDCSGGHAPF